MFSFFQIGPLEVLSVIGVGFVVGVLGFLRVAAWRWLAVIACVLVIAMICTPADPLSMWLVAIPTCAVFATGVILSPYLSGRARTSSAR